MKCARLSTNKSYSFMIGRGKAIAQEENEIVNVQCHSYSRVPKEKNASAKIYMRMICILIENVAIKKDHEKLCTFV